MKFQMIIFSFIMLILIFSSCSKTGEVNNYESVKPVDHEYFKRIASLESGSTVEIIGNFDLKSPCLNINSEKKETQSICKITLAENSETNAEYINTLLKVCNNQIRANCIESLPENAPPEVIKIRDKNSKPVEPWSSVKVTLRISKKDQINDIEAVQIESTK